MSISRFPTTLVLSAVVTAAVAVSVLVTAHASLRDNALLCAGTALAAAAWATLITVGLGTPRPNHPHTSSLSVSQQADIPAEQPPRSGSARPHRGEAVDRGGSTKMFTPEPLLIAGLHAPEVEAPEVEVFMLDSAASAARPPLSVPAAARLLRY
jgi:hypothetical protein